MNAWKEMSSALGIDIILAHTSYDSLRTSFMKQERSKNVKDLLVKAAIPLLNWSHPTSQNKREKRSYGASLVNWFIFLFRISK